MINISSTQLAKMFVQMVQLTPNASNNKTEMRRFPSNELTGTFTQHIKSNFTIQGNTPAQCKVWCAVEPDGVDSVRYTISVECEPNLFGAATIGAFVFDERTDEFADTDSFIEFSKMVSFIMQNIIIEE